MREITVSFSGAPQIRNFERAFRASARGRIAPGQEDIMNPEIYTERARGFIQSAQTGARRAATSNSRPSTC